jgi:medium-chain acyl-[acyl-carrier-protein] hydrolase
MALTRHREPLVKISGPDDPARRLVYFPFAGGGTSTVKPWLPAIPEDTQVLAVRLPGREIRLNEKPLDSVHAVVEALREPLLPFLDRPFAFLGHSVGALQAFEMTRELRRLGLPQPERLVVSGRRAPHLPSLTRHVHALPEDDFVVELRGYEGTPEIILRDRQVRAMFLPTIRADFKISEDYHHSEEAPLDCPILAFGGMRDAMVPVPDLMAWDRHTAAGFDGHLLQGGHFFQNTALAPVIGLLRAALSSEPATARVAPQAVA